jgi:hypothetical protein
MDGSDAPELDKFDIGQEVWRDQIAGRDHAKACGKGKPDRRSQGKRFCSRLAAELFSDRDGRGHWIPHSYIVL